MGDLKQPLLDGNGVDSSYEGVEVSGYAKAGLLSKAGFFWLNPLLKRGFKQVIVKDDVPILSPQHRASSLYERFSTNWPTKREPNAVWRTLWKTFRNQFLVCSVLQMWRLSVLFVGPLLIQNFVDVTSGNERFVYEGYFLVVLLFVAKCMEAGATHQYNFQCQKMGMQIRSAMIAVLYRKGLRLSSSSRQSNGAGQIVNFMSVDVQQLSDACIQLNNIWVVPVQMTIAMVILFRVVGMSGLAGLLVLIIVSLVCYTTAKSIKSFLRGVLRGKDTRMNITIEALSNMKIIKLQAWDDKFKKNIERTRGAEYWEITKTVYTSAAQIYTLWQTPLAFSSVIFAFCFLLGNPLNPVQAFTTIATVRLLQDPLRLFPNTVIAVSQALVSLDRVEKYLWSQELDTGNVEELLSNSDTAIIVEGGSFTWDAELRTAVLCGINVEVKRGSLVAVVGRVGAGKSSLLAALLGEMTKVAGRVKVGGSTAYVSQSAWIQNGTIQDNILFGQPMDKLRYDRVLEKCALRTDLALMEFGDQTEIGERGLNLSGGQKQRIQLARAVYQDCDTYFLDDIFSAVDAHTGTEIFQKCISETLADKTVVLVTHQMDLLAHADLILVMRGGRIVQSGTYSELLQPETDFWALVVAHSQALEKVEFDEDPIHENEPFVVVTSPASPSVNGSPAIGFSTGSPRAESAPEVGTDQANLPRTISKKLSYLRSDSVKMRKSAKLIEEEERETGRVSFSVYWLYLTQAYGGVLVVFLIFVQVIWQVLQIRGDYWVANGSSAEEQSHSQAKRFVIVYAAYAFSCAFFVLLRSLICAIIGLITAQKFFQGMLNNLFRAPMSFFDTTPTGRILSRASTDQLMTDITIPTLFSASVAMVSQMLGILVVTCVITWPVTFVVIPLAICYIYLQNYYFSTARELTRVDALTKAPVIQHFSETIAGFVTIRCFKQQERFVKVNLERVNSNLRMDFHNSASMEWVGIRMELLGVLVLCLSTLMMVHLPATVMKPELVGLSLAYSLSLNQCLFVVAWLYCQLENKMVSVERLGQYLKLPCEAELVIKKSRPHSDWPCKGTIKLQNLKLRYRPETPLILKGISVTIEGGNKVGVVGRTGSGKSTLVLALFRLVEPVEGYILIDNIDISSIGLNDLRSRLSIIPQDPTLFDGTVRSNLDPLGEHSDGDIWEALEKSQLASSIRQLELKLESPIGQNGENWSLGQRQLFCLGRALLKHSRILVLDEATASVDTQTDVLMQSIVRREFQDCTVISIAHRIPSVMDSDKVLVLDAGELKECGSPASLLEKPTSLFASLVHEYTARS